MIILRLFLYIICIICVVWTGLVFGGPPVIKRLISGYTDGALTPSGVTVSPRLVIGISLLEFSAENEIAGWHIEGFSRATELELSFFGEKPFLEINLGPSVLKDHATADGVNFFTPPFQQIDWQNIAVFANISNLALNSSSKMNSLNLAGNLNLGSANVSNVKIDAKEFSAKNYGSNYAAHLITGDLTELNLNVPITEQLFSGAFAIENIIVSQPNFTIPEAIIEISVEEEIRNIKFGLSNLKLSEFGDSIENLKIDGYFNKFNDLQELQVDLTDWVFNKSQKFPKISVGIIKSGDEQYQANITGDLEEFELSDSDTFIGLLPAGNFVIDLEMDRAVSKVSSISKIYFNTLNAADIVGNAEMGFSSELLTNLKCSLADCELYNFDLSYMISFDDEWVKGSARCAKKFCILAEMEHLVRTSNTVNIFATLNRTDILSPLSSLYLYGAISSGKKINRGHELKFQF